MNEPARMTLHEWPSTNQQRRIACAASNPDSGKLSTSWRMTFTLAARPCYHRRSF